MAYLPVGYTVGPAPRALVQHPVPVFHMFWVLALLIPTFNVIVLEARVVRVLNRFAQGVEIVQRGDESLQRR